MIILKYNSKDNKIAHKWTNNIEKIKISSIKIKNKTQQKQEKET